ncbi:DUF2471 family protein [Paraburkholderia caballeronis]|uniref:DUF2471 domain-containing protein n=1 Tax=Paraburkholderia caballeronis TaxID=416943 RepID=A0A1H7SXF9_9BURK|nr:DUF2471 domain-containing protein [Paraburkholderia caballeronis]PXW25724.1 hypothetical protein C7403_105407 [Paraburkholderia caballeronis]PXX01331.1 hypothetical protein C7407_105406 [Paraburkholderia caballeronis]RAJ99315.1 hypothetical protein C7409_10544 [Paraburkholderia caballeronis]TDV05482.1 hypothetical protein C7408_12613 [Paraburkholderia caballeronis]TDV09109.1 hypothetical protein C7406_12813 [Paraburkholderia caballeronis]
MNEFFAAETAIRNAIPAIVAKHRSAGTLTWALLHRMEREALDAVAETGQHSSRVLRTLRASPLLHYPKNDTPVSFEGHDVVPPIFAAISDAWLADH